jgi:hypothetical protein
MKTGKLRLGPLPNQETIKVTVTLTAALREELDDYARIYGQEFEQSVEMASLIPHMLRAFIARDRTFRRMRAAMKRGNGL